MIPKPGGDSRLLFIAQIILIYIIVISSIVILALQIGGNSNLWVALLSSSLGYLLPAPSLSLGKGGEGGGTKASPARPHTL